MEWQILFYSTFKSKTKKEIKDEYWRKKGYQNFKFARKRNFDIVY